MSDAESATESATESASPTTPADSSAAGPSRRVAPVITALIAVVFIALFVVLLRAQPAQNDTAATPLLNRAAPAASGTRDDGSTFELSHRKGSWVVLNFFTYNCVPCIEEQPELVAFVEQQQALGLDGAEFYSIARDTSRDEAHKFFSTYGGGPDWPVVYDTDYSFVNGFGVALVPETWIIDPNGVVRFRTISTVTADGLSQVVQQLRESR